MFAFLLLFEFGLNLGKNIDFVFSFVFEDSPNSSEL